MVDPNMGKELTLELMHCAKISGVLLLTTQLTDSLIELSFQDDINEPKKLCDNNNYKGKFTKFSQHYYIIISCSIVNARYLYIKSDKNYLLSRVYVSGEEEQTLGDFRMRKKPKISNSRVKNASKKIPVCLNNCNKVKNCLGVQIVDTNCIILQEYVYEAFLNQSEDVFVFSRRCHYKNTNNINC